MEFPYTLFEVTLGLIIIYLAFVCYLFFLVKKIFPDFWNKAYPYGVMMTKAGYIPLLSSRFFEVGFSTFKGHLQMIKVLLTSHFSENRKIRLIKNISRILLVASLAMLLYLVFVVSTIN